ncbi:Ig-like domain-containing protein [Halobacillus sp. MO56]
MKKSLKILVSLLLFSIFSVLSIQQANAQGTIPAKNWDHQEEVSPDKSWTITFNTEIQQTNANKEAIFVKDSNGQQVENKIIIDGKQVIVEPPAEKYKPNHTYELHIEKNLTSSDGVEMAQPVIMPFTIEKNPHIQNGTWERELDHNGATLVISELNEDSFSFSINAVSGANTGWLEGKAHLTKDGATYQDEMGCHMTFTPINNGIEIENNYECNYYGGLGVFFDGEYLNPDIPTEERLPFVEMGLFTKEENNTFKELTGDYYSRFKESFHLVYDMDNQDTFEATIKHGYVRGLGGIMEGVIMSSKNGEIYAAVIGTAPNGEDTILYFTTDATYASKLPKTIQSWVNNLHTDYQIYYIN